MNNCLICQRISQIKQGTNKYFVCELDTAYVVLGDSQFYKGYTLLLSKHHCSELHQLDKAVKLRFLEEMSIVAEAMFEVFQPVKLNYELLGNRHAHLHWHLFPRHVNDPNIHNPIWIIDKTVRNNTFLPETELKQTIKNLQTAIQKYTQT